MCVRAHSQRDNVKATITKRHSNNNNQIKHIVEQNVRIFFSVVITAARAHPSEKTGPSDKCLTIFGDIYM